MAPTPCLTIKAPQRGQHPAMAPLIPFHLASGDQFAHEYPHTITHMDRHQSRCHLTSFRRTGIHLSMRTQTSQHHTTVHNDTNTRPTLHTRRSPTVSFVYKRCVGVAVRQYLPRFLKPLALRSCAGINLDFRRDVRRDVSRYVRSWPSYSGVLSLDQVRPCVERGTRTRSWQVDVARSSPRRFRQYFASCCAVPSSAQPCCHEFDKSACHACCPLWNPLCSDMLMDLFPFFRLRR